MSGDKSRSAPATMAPELLEILVCPETYQPLALAPPELVAKLNQAVERGELINRAGQKIEKPIEAGLVRQDQAVLYLVADGIPIMLVDEAIPLDQVN